MGNKFLLIVSIVGYACWSIFQKLALQKISPFHVQIIGCGFATLLIPVYFWLIKTNSSYPSGPVDISGVCWAIAASIATAIASIAYIINIKSANVGVIASLTSVYPALVVILAAIFLKEQITLAKIAGILLVLVGIFILGK